MKEIISGLLSGLIAYIFNKLLIDIKKEKAIVYFIPLVEESSKTLIGLLINANIIWVHFIFGIIEALYDWFNAKSDRVGLIAIILSIVSHSIFGFLSYLIIKWTGTVILAIIIPTIIHSLWNYFILKDTPGS